MFLQISIWFVHVHVNDTRVKYQLIFKSKTCDFDDLTKSKETVDF